MDQIKLDFAISDIGQRFMSLTKLLNEKKFNNGVGLCDNDVKKS